MREVKAIGLQWVFDGWKIWTTRQSYVLWYEEPYFLRWVALVPPFCFLIVPTQAWVPLKNHSKARIQKLISKISAAIPSPTPFPVPKPVPIKAWSMGFQRAA